MAKSSDIEGLVGLAFLMTDEKIKKASVQVSIVKNFHFFPEVRPIFLFLTDKCKSSSAG